MLHWLTNGAFPLFPSCPPFFLHSHVSLSSLLLSGQARPNVCIYVLLNKGFFIPHLFLLFHFQFPLLTSASIFHLSFALYLNGKNYQLSSDERALLIAEPEGSYQSALCSNRKHDTAFSRWQLQCLCVHLCQGFLSPASPLCVCVSKRPWYFSQLRPYQLIRPVHFLWYGIRGQSSAEPHIHTRRKKVVCV